MLKLLFLPFRLVWELVCAVLGISWGLVKLIFGLLGGMVSLLTGGIVLLLVIGLIVCALHQKKQGNCH